MRSGIRVFSSFSIHLANWITFLGNCYDRQYGLGCGAVGSLSPRCVPAHNLGFIGTAYTAAHEGMELLLTVYLRRTMKLGQNKTRGHDLGELFMMWNEKGRTAAELAYQHGVAQDLEVNRILPATLKVAMNVSPPSKIMPPDFSERKIEYEEASRRHIAELLCKAFPTVGNVVRRLDAALGPRNITWLCPGYADEIQGHSWRPDV